MLEKLDFSLINILGKILFIVIISILKVSGNCFLKLSCGFVYFWQHLLLREVFIGKSYLNKKNLTLTSLNKEVYQIKSNKQKKKMVSYILNMMSYFKYLMTQPKCPKVI